MNQEYKHMEGEPMKKLIIVLLIMAVMSLVGSFSALTQAQNPASQVKPTFLAPTPGIYVNGWPAFTVSYPKEWVKQPFRPGEVIRVAAPDSKTFPPIPNFVISVFPSPLPIDNWSKISLPIFSKSGRDFKIINDKPSQLKDGTPAQEAELEWVRNDGVKVNMLVLITKKEDIWIPIIVASDKGKVEEDLKNYAYSLTFQPSREEPLKVSSDVREFFDQHCSDIVSGDVGRIMTKYSDQFSHNGTTKASLEQWLWNDRFSPIQRGVTSVEATVTFFEAQGDKAYLDGFFCSKGRDDTKPMKVPMSGTQIIKENDQWKFYGNHKE
jgi:hypothetical protein